MQKYCGLMKGFYFMLFPYYFVNLNYEFNDSVLN